MTFGVSRKKRFAYVLPRDRDIPAGQRRPTFYFRTLSATTRAEIDLFLAEKSEALKPGELPPEIATKSIKVLGEALVGWDELADETGTLHAFANREDGGASEDSIDFLQPADRYTLAVVAINQSFLPEEDRKK